MKQPGLLARSLLLEGYVSYSPWMQMRGRTGAVSESKDTVGTKETEVLVDQETTSRVLLLGKLGHEVLR